MNNPKISIITISYNSEKTIEETIQSVVSQDYDNLEYLIIDGGSNDATMEIVDKYRDKIDYSISEPDKGICDAFNKGISHATGEIIGIINSDDILLPSALEIVASLYAPDIDVYSGNVLMWNEENGQTYIRKPSVEFKNLRTQFKACHPARFISRKAYEKYGIYSLDFRYCMDVDLLIRFCKSGAKVIHIDKELTKFRIGATSSDSIFNKKQDYAALVRNNGGSKWDFWYTWVIGIIKYYGKRVLSSMLGERFFVKFRSLFKIG